MNNDIVTMALMDYLYQAELARLEFYDKCDEYYNGEHPLKIPDKYKSILKSEYAILANYCAPIVDAPVSRLKLKGISCEDPKAKQLLEKVWKDNRMDAKTVKVHRQAVLKGDCFVQVWVNTVNGQKKYKIDFIKPEHIFAFYSTDDDESLEYVKRQWVGFIDNIPTAFKYLYYPDRIERYYSMDCTTNSGVLSNLFNYSWLPYDPDGMGAVIPNPYGVIPIVHFRNKPTDCPFGTSELLNAFPIQDGINKLIVDLMRTADFQAYKQRYICGVDEEDIPVNPATNRRELLSNPGDVWRFADPATNVGELQAEDLNGILTAIDKLVDHICTVTRTPKTTLQDSSGTASSGFALAKVEAPLIAKVEEMQVSFGNSYEDINKLILLMANVNGDLAGEIPDTEIVWADLKEVSPTDKLSEAQRLQILKQNGVISAAEWQRLEGYTAEQIATLQQELATETNANVASLLGHSFGE